MKEIRETKLVEQTTVKFIADDGKEFATETECKEHERTQNFSKLEAEYKKLVLTDIKIPFDDVCGEVKLTIVKLKDKTDFFTLRDYAEAIRYTDSYVYEKEEEIATYPCTAVFESTDGWNDIYYINRIADLKQDLQKVIERIDNANV